MKWIMKLNENKATNEIKAECIMMPELKLARNAWMNDWMLIDWRQSINEWRIDYGIKKERRLAASRKINSLLLNFNPTNFGNEIKINSLPVMNWFWFNEIGLELKWQQRLMQLAGLCFQHSWN